MKFKVLLHEVHYGVLIGWLGLLYTSELRETRVKVTGGMGKLHILQVATPFLDVGYAYILSFSDAGVMHIFM